MREYLAREYFGNTLMMYLIALGMFAAGIIIIVIFRKIILTRVKRWADKTETTTDNFIVSEVERTIVPLLYYIAFYIALNTLVLHPKISDALKIISVALLTFFIIKLIISILKYLLSAFLQKAGETENREKQLRGISTLLSLLLWGLGIVFLLDNIGFKISAVIAGLGIGGIAIALAAQKILGDLFSYFVIFFDRPFQIGDFIIIDNKMGSVEYIGIKSTKLRSLSGEQLIVSNTDLVNSRIHNYKRMERRRIVFQFGVVYDTGVEKLTEIPVIIKKIIEGINGVTFDRAHFLSYGDSSLVFEVVYIVLSEDYNKYMDFQQEINIKMYREFDARGIKFAFPTRTLYVNKVGGAGEIDAKTN